MKSNCRPYSRVLIDYLYNSGMRFGFTPDSAWFNMHGRFVNVIRLSKKSWEVHYMSHVYRFYNQLDLIEWIENQKRYGK